MYTISKLLTVVLIPTAVLVAAPPKLSSLQFLQGDNSIRAAAVDQQLPAIARGGNEYLTVWQDSRGGNSGQDIYAARLDAAGHLIDTVPFPIAVDAADQTVPRVSWNGQNWLVTWISQLPTEFFYSPQIQAVRVSREGVILDAQPLTLTNLNTSDLQYALASDGSNWLVVYQGSSAGDAAVRGVRVSGAGAILDPVPGVVILTETFFLRFSLSLAYGSGRYLFTWNEFGSTTGEDVMGLLLTPSVVKVGSPFAVTATGATEQHARVDSNGTDFFVIWDAGGAVAGSRVTRQGLVTDPGGVRIAGVNAFGPLPDVTWDGRQWIAAWTDIAVKAARISASGTVLDPGGFVVNGVNAAIKVNTQLAGAQNGGAMLVWQDSQTGSVDVWRAAIRPGGTAGASAAISQGQPSQVSPRFATDGSRYVTTFLSITSSETRVMAQAMTAAGGSRSAPVVLGSGALLASPAIAWNGTEFLVVWSDESANQILGRLVDVNGSPLGAAFPVMAGDESDVAANGGVFLVVGSNAPTNPEFRFPFAVRVDAAGAVLGTPVAVGSSFSVNPAVGNLGSGWLVAWEQHPTHDNPNSGVWGAIVASNGNPQPSQSLSASNSPVHERPGVAGNANEALVVWQDRRIANDYNIYGQRVLPDGTLLDGIGFAVSTALNAQVAARAGWTGNAFVVAWEDLRANTFFIDERTDIFATRVTVGGQVVDPAGIPIATQAAPDAEPAVSGTGGTALMGGAIFRANPPYAAFRVGVRLIGFQGNELPVAVPAAAPLSGTAPLSVSFSSAGSSDPDGSIASVRWNFGDGSTSTSPNPEHTYATPGTYFVNLMVTDDRGATATDALMITALAPPPLPGPVAVASASPTSGQAPLTVQFSSAGTTGATSFLWIFGDSSTVAERNPVHSYTSPGIFSAQLLVTDDQGNLSSDIVDITVSGVMRTTGITINPVWTGAQTDVSGTVTVQDPNGQPVAGAQVSIHWTLPGPFVVPQIASTGTNGVAHFSANDSARHGTYTLTVDDVVKGGYTFDRAGSVLTKSVSN